MFRSVKSGKISELIVQQIKNAIIEGEIKAGDRLPSERELVERFEASRISIREALKRLETAGLLTIKPGSGVFIAGVSSKPISELFSSILRIQKTSIYELTEARIILEPNIARLASEKVSPEDLLRLEQNIKEASEIIESNSPPSATNIGFHSLIAEATRNPVISLTMRTMFNIWQEWSLELENNIRRRMKTSRHSIEYHKKILKALREKKSQEVYELMLKHTFQIQRDLKGIKSQTK
jgi:GntR family transcriptional repressor for pyruvate dehydrogenase complex